MPTTDSWGTYIQGYLNAEAAAGHPKTTRNTRRQHLENLARGVGRDPLSLTFDELITWVSQRDWAAETRRGRYNTYRSFWRWLAVTHGGEDIAANLPKVKLAVPHARPAPKSVYLEALARSDHRTRLILRLAAELGLRRAEVAQVHSSDVQEDLYGYSLVVHGKGNRTRVIPLPDGLAIKIRNADGWLFPGDDNGHLSPRYVGKLATRVLNGGWTLHTLRHRFASLAYAVDRDVFVVQELLGHASPATTRRYVELPREAMRKTVLAAAAA